MRESVDELRLVLNGELVRNVARVANDVDDVGRALLQMGRELDGSVSDGVGNCRLFAIVQHPIEVLVQLARHEIAEVNLCDRGVLQLRGNVICVPVSSP